MVLLNVEMIGWLNLNFFYRKIYKFLFFVRIFLNDLNIYFKIVNFK